MKEFDYIIVGGGSAGCVLAARLSEDAGASVLLIESGGRDTDPFIHIPAGLGRVINKGRDIVAYVSDPEPHMNNRLNVVPQGKVLGGGSSINGMVYIRGQAQDYDDWRQMGCTGWSYADVLPVFRAMENNERLSDEYHGTAGELHVSDRRYKHVLSQAFLAAAGQAGYPVQTDFNGASQLGFGGYQTTTHKGRRQSAAVAFLRKALGRPNLTLLTDTKVARVTFSGRKASGVALESGELHAARREVVLAAGALATPKILLLSGIGPAQDLKAHGIDVIADLPGVGANYQDHLESVVQYETRDPISMFRADKGVKAAMHMLQYQLFRKGLLSSTIIDTGGFVDSLGRGRADIQFHMMPVMAPSHDRPAIMAHGFSIHPGFLQPRSRGSVHLRSANPRDPIRFSGGAFSDPEDLETLLRGVKIAMRIGEQPALAKLVKRRALPSEDAAIDDDALRDYVRANSKTTFHPTGTAKMGAPDDAMAVVDPLLRVRSVDGLRVADASIMPRIVSGNTNAPTMMIAERASRFVRDAAR